MIKTPVIVAGADASKIFRQQAGGALHVDRSTACSQGLSSLNVPQITVVVGNMKLPSKKEFYLK
jgi:hypothetical protein